MSRFFQLALLAVCLIGCAPGDTVVQNEPSENKTGSNDSITQADQQPDQEEMADQKEKPGQKEMADQEENSKQTETDGLETFADFEAYFKKEMTAYMQRYRVAPTKAEKKKEYANRPMIKPFQARLTELLKNSSVSEETRKGVQWWYKKARVEDHEALVLRLIVENFPEAEFMEEHIYKLAYDVPQAEAEKYLRSILEVNTYDTARARATYHLRDILNKNVKELEGEKAEMARKELDALKDMLMTKHADAKNISGISLLEMVEGQEFASKLQIGKPVPDIAGTDLDGVEFKLSDYRGKVTMLSFWGFW